MLNSNNQDAGWKVIYRIGGLSAVGAVLVGAAEIGISFLPGGSAVQMTVSDWFVLFQQQPFMGLRNLGLLNIFLNILAVFIFLALYAAHRKTPYQPYAVLAVVFSYLGLGIFFATNRAFSMLGLSRQYAAATSDGARQVLEAAGQAMLAVGESHTPGTFLGFVLVELAGIMISLVMLKSGVFGKVAAYAGILGFGILAIFEVLASFGPGTDVVMMVAMLGGLFSMAWYLLIARRLFQLGKE